MIKYLGKWLNIYKDEIGLFLWSAALLFLIRSSNIVFNNFAETAFLKRFGVEYLPVIYVINSITAFIIMGFLTGIMARTAGSRMLSYMLLICGSTVAGLWFVVPLGIDLIYPVLYVLKTQYEVLLGLLFWNMASDLFNTRQSKRLFPLITAGGVLGSIIGSVGIPFILGSKIPFIQKSVSIDDLMWLYLMTTFAGALVVYRLGILFPTFTPGEMKRKKAKKRSSFPEEFKKVFPLIKESLLIKIVIMLYLLPNVAIPILNYQFNFAIDRTFATENKMIEFFSIFRGAMNIVSFIILLFVGKLYGRWGLPVALMFHPINYIIAFLGFLFRFDMFAAMYARLSTTVLRTTINTPARAVLMGIFPASYRAIILPFLRGTVVRVGTLCGSFLIIVLGNLFHPRFLSIAAILFVGGWAVSTFILKRQYSRILLDLVSKNMIDLKSLEKGDMSQIFLDNKVRKQLVATFLSSEGSKCLWYAELIQSLGIKDLDTHILSVIRKQDDKTKIALLNLLSSQAGEDAVHVLEELAELNNPDLTLAVLKVAVRVPNVSKGFLQKVFDTFEDSQIRAYAVIGLFQQDPEPYRAAIDAWLSSPDPAEKKAGIIAAGGSGDEGYVPTLRTLLDQEKDGSVLALILEAFHSLKVTEINDIVLPYLKHPSAKVRQAGLGAVDISDDNSMRSVIPLLGDRVAAIGALAEKRLQETSYQNALLFFEALAVPNLKLREGIFSLLESLQITDIDVYRFTQAQFERAYCNLAEAEALKGFDECRERDLLVEHLNQKKAERVETVLRVLAAQDRTGKLRLISRGIYSHDARQRSNALEALEDTVGHSISMTMIPLLEDISPSQCLETGYKAYQLPRFDSKGDTIFPHLLSKYDWVTLLLSLNYISRRGDVGLDQNILDKLTGSENPWIGQLAQSVLSRETHEASLKEMEMETEIGIPDKIFHLRNIQIFEGLSVRELAAVASVTEEVVFPAGSDVIKQGQQGDTMFMIISGQVLVVKSQEGGSEIELDQIDAGDYFGEMALFEDILRSATIRTKVETRLLVLHKAELNEIVREYPQIALHICTVLNQRIRKLHEKIQGLERRTEGMAS